MKLTCGYPIVPAGAYVGKLVDIETRDSEWGTRLVWRFEITEGEFAGQEVVRFTSAKATPKSACGQFVKSLTGKTNGEIDTDELKGEPVRILVVPSGDKTRVESVTLDHDLAR